MKRSLCLLLALCTAMFCFGGCGDKTPNPPKNENGSFNITADELKNGYNHYAKKLGCEPISVYIDLDAKDQKQYIGDDIWVIALLDGDDGPVESVMIDADSNSESWKKSIQAFISYLDQTTSINDLTNMLGLDEQKESVSAFERNSAENVLYSYTKTEHGASLMISTATVK